MKSITESFKQKYEILEVGKKFRDARIKAGLTQSQVAKKINVSQQMIAQFEKGKNSPSIKTVIRIAEAVSKKIEIKLAEGDIIIKQKDLEDININTYLQVFWHDVVSNLTSMKKIDSFLHINEIIDHFLTRGENHLNTFLKNKKIKSLTNDKELLYDAISAIYLAGASDAMEFLWTALQVKGYING